MIEVALETSFREASVAVRVDGRLDETTLDPEGAHASELLPRLDELLRAHGAEPRRIDAVFVGVGPGSYTGLRVGIATALGLARGAEAELRGEPSAEVLLARELEPGQTGSYLLDARQGQLYFARYANEDGVLRELDAPGVLSPAEARAALGSDEGPIYCDAGAPLAAALEGSLAARVRQGVVPRASALLELASKRLGSLGPHAPQEVAPLYLREFQAKERRR